MLDVLAWTECILSPSPVNVSHQWEGDSREQETICLRLAHVFAPFCLSGSGWTCRNFHPPPFSWKCTGWWDACGGTHEAVHGHAAAVWWISPTICGRCVACPAKVVPDRLRGLKDEQRLQKSQSGRVRRSPVWVYFLNVLFWVNYFTLLGFGCLYEKRGGLYLIIFHGD